MKGAWVGHFLRLPLGMRRIQKKSPFLFTQIQFPAGAKASVGDGVVFAMAPLGRFKATAFLGGFTFLGILFRAPVFLAAFVFAADFFAAFFLGVFFALAMGVWGS